MVRIQKNNFRGVAEMKNPDNFNMDIPGFGGPFAGFGGEAFASAFSGFGNMGGGNMNGGNSFSQSFSSVSFNDDSGISLTIYFRQRWSFTYPF